jgi:hypothetical protein
LRRRLVTIQQVTAVADQYFRRARRSKKGQDRQPPSSFILAGATSVLRQLSGAFRIGAYATGGERRERYRATKCRDPGSAGNCLPSHPQLGIFLCRCAVLAPQPGGQVAKSEIYPFFDRYTPYLAELLNGRYSISVNNGIEFLSGMRKISRNVYDKNAKGTAFIGWE